jgi:hypothetical protein
MDKFSGWSEEYAFTTIPNGCTKIYIFSVHEESLIQETDCFGIWALYEKTGTADPVRKLFLSHFSFYVLAYYRNTICVKLSN